MIKLLVFLTPLLVFASTVSAHSGGTDASGCHHDRKNGGYHCHGAKTEVPPSRDIAAQDEDVVFNQKSLKIHRPGCKSAKGCTVNCVTIKRSEATRRNGVACGNCGG